MANNDQESKRQMIIGGVLLVVVIIIGWQMMSLFGHSSESAPASAESTAQRTGAAAPPPMPTPKPAEVAKPVPLTQREAELLQKQQEIQEKYLAAVNELQMLKIQKDIAETNKAIAAARLDAVSSQKNIVTMLSPDQSGNYSQHLPNAEGIVTSGNTQRSNVPSLDVNYTVISVTEIQGRWAAVMGAQGKLYNVHVGDVLPLDSFKVVSIDRNGVMLQKDGVKKTISLVPII